MVGPVDAEDCFQETFLSALRAYPRLTRHDQLRAWLFTIARNKATDHHRAGARRPTPVEDVGEHAGSAAGASSLEAGNLWELVAELPAKQRTAVALRYACDLRYTELASAMDCSEEAARRSVHEGLKKLRMNATSVREFAASLEEAR
jgi:RNA polymerase sigma factor (sigma-70 family)